MAEAAPRELVLVGGGHCHALVLRELVRKPLADARVTLVCDAVWAPYSGMLPGQVAGHYSHADTHIDLQHLCRAAGARLLADPAVGIDRAQRRLLLASGLQLRYDILSLNIGATPRMQAEGAAEHAVAVKPISAFHTRWEALLSRLRQQTGAITVAVVGAGAAGVELVLALQYRLQRELGEDGTGPSILQLHLFSGSASVLPGHNARVRRRFERELAERGIVVHHGVRVDRVTAGALHTDAGVTVPADEVIWATQAGAAGWLRETGLALDDAGFVAVLPTLRSVNDAAVFAAGDVASVQGCALEKAGVVAVRQAPVLAGNLRRALAGQRPVTWQPQHRWLSLVSTGDRYAVASRGSFSAAGRWVWIWKDTIDRRFMRQFTKGIEP
ncbi:MAG: FAD-dependent oxidoreductase [Ramlibacter sp.]